MTSNVFYTLLKDDNTEDGVGEFWTEEQAMAHVKRCAWVENNIGYTLVEHNIEDSLQPTEPKRKRRKSNSESSG